jgi:hypothetical protein
VCEELSSLGGLPKETMEIVMSVSELIREFPEVAPRRRDIVPKVCGKLDDIRNTILGQKAETINQTPSWTVILEGTDANESGSRWE